jgi:hypothetical protein
MREIIYYTNNLLAENIMITVQGQILKSDLPVLSVSLKSIDFGNNVVVDAEPGVITMFKQILTGLEVSKADTVFLAEHDVLYHPSHFSFAPIRDNIYYYNTNVWRWDYPKDRLITYDHLAQLSGLCASRKLLLNHYFLRLQKIEEKEFEDGRDPNWARKMGYEPGKAKRRGGFLDEETAEWQSAYPNIDIRHKGTVTPPKVSLNSFRHQPTGWRETTLDKVEGWDGWNFQF